MKNNCLLIGFRLLLCALLVLVGSSSCTVEPLEDTNDYLNPEFDPDNPSRVYFRIQGTIFQEASKTLRNARVITKYCFDDIGAVPADTTYSDGLGQFCSYGVAYSDSMRVVAEDTSGTLAPDSVDLRLELNVFNYVDNNNLKSYIYEGWTGLKLKSRP